MPDIETITPVVPFSPIYVPPTEEKKAFLKAFAAAQGEFLPIVREKQVNIAGKDGKPGYSFKYAELAVILDACRPALSKNGLSIRSRILPGVEAGTVWLQSILGHAEGYEDISEMLIHIAGDLKQFGGQLTYLRRYVEGPQLGVASEDDIDGNGHGAGEGGSDNGAIGGNGVAGTPVASTQRRTPQRAAAKAPAQDAMPPAPPPPEGTIATKPAAPVQAAAQQAQPPAQPPAQAPSPAATDAAASAPAQGQAAEEDAGEIASSGQIKWAKTKLESFTAAESKKWLEERGVRSLDSLTEAQFAALRPDLVKL